ncbi:MAG: hypothetical protein K5896_04190 [Prevotella sp.]|nr:hypothetical protein [Prevotella sp.]
METTTGRRRRTAHPMSYYLKMVQDMDDSQKLELVSILIESVKPAIKREQSDACIDSVKREQARPEVKPIQTRTVFETPFEEEFPDMDKELYTAEEAYELTMKDIKAIYDEKDAV